MSADFSRRVVAYALLRQGLPYVWSGKGLLCWGPEMSVPTPIAAGCPEAYDCSGLVTSSVFAAGGPDLRFRWSAQSMWDLLSPPVTGEQRRLRLFGSDREHVSHVAIELGHDYQLEASGGDSTTTSYAAALKRGAKVRVTDTTLGRMDLLGYRSLKAMQFALKGTQ